MCASNPKFPIHLQDGEGKKQQYSHYLRKGNTMFMKKNQLKQRKVVLLLIWNEPFIFLDFFFLGVRHVSTVA